MKFGKWLGVVLVGLGCGSAAHAQAGVYVGYSATRMSGITCFDPQSFNSQGLCYNANTSATTSANNHVDPSGVMLGGYYDFLSLGLVKLGADLRYSHDRANKSAADGGGGKDVTEANTVLGGVRGQVRTPLRWLKPYGQMSFGWTSSNAAEPFCATTVGPVGTPQSSCSGTPVNAPRRFDNFFRYEGFVGADIRIASILDLRAIELGIGNMSRIGSGSTVVTSATPTGTAITTAPTTSSIGIRTIGAGLVFHLPSSK
jgi:hypothetical protein